jgi:hypothetical protein
VFFWIQWSRSTSVFVTSHEDFPLHSAISLKLFSQTLLSTSTYPPSNQCLGSLRDFGLRRFSLLNTPNPLIHKFLKEPMTNHCANSPRSVGLERSCFLLKGSHTLTWGIFKDSSLLNTSRPLSLLSLFLLETLNFSKCLFDT